jgi:hypothetical protein
MAAPLRTAVELPTALDDLRLPDGRPCSKTERPWAGNRCGSNEIRLGKERPENCRARNAGRRDIHGLVYDPDQRTRSNCQVAMASTIMPMSIAPISVAPPGATYRSMFIDPLQRSIFGGRRDAAAIWNRTRAPALLTPPWTSKCGGTISTRG